MTGVYGFSLGYYNTPVFKAYTPIGGISANAFGLQYQPTDDDVRSSESGKSLFNGNISHAADAFIRSMCSGTLQRF